jgi:hypothetical protein
MLGRRVFIAAVGATAGAASAAELAGSGLSTTLFDERLGSGPPLEHEELLGLRKGDRIDRWTVSRLEERCNAVAVMLRMDVGMELQVDVLARDPSGRSPQPIAETASYALYLSNRGDGATPTDNEQGLAAMALARAIDAAASLSGSAPLRLATFAERTSAHPSGPYDTQRA